MGGLEGVVEIEGRNWASLKEVEKRTGVPYGRLRQKARPNKGGNSRVESLEFRKIGHGLYMAEDNLPKLKEESKCITSGEYYSITEAGKKIVGDNKAKRGKLTTQLWEHKDELIEKGLVVYPKTCLESYLKKDFVHGLAKRCLVMDAVEVLGLERREFWRRTKLSKDDESRIVIRKHRNILSYVPWTELERQAKLLGREDEYNTFIRKKGRKPIEKPKKRTQLIYGSKLEQEAKSLGVAGELGLAKKKGPYRGRTQYKFTLSEIEEILGRKIRKTQKRSTVGFYNGKKTVPYYFENSEVYVLERDVMRLLIESVRMKTRKNDCEDIYKAYFLNRYREIKIQKIMENRDYAALESGNLGNIDESDVEGLQEEFWQENKGMKNTLYHAAVKDKAREIMDEFIAQRR